jgi:hypothetical protein
MSRSSRNRYMLCLYLKSSETVWTSVARPVRAIGEDLGEVVADGEGLEAEAQVAGDGDAVFADHGDAGTAVCGVVSG